MAKRTGTLLGTDGRPARGASWDERAARLYEDFRASARSLVRRAYGSTFGESEIEDFYSSAWLGTFRALARRHRDLSDEEIRSYFLTAVAHHASKEIRRRKRKPIAPLDEVAAVVPDHGASPEEAVSVKETSTIARDVLSSLPPRRRAVILLRYGLELEPKEVCGLVRGLSHRAYRKEISRGVDELARKMRLVESGRWCDERESLLKAYAAGLANSDQSVQAQQHLSHCRHCSEFVARLSGHLHDLGGSLALSGAIDSLDGHISLVGRAGELVHRARDVLPGGAGTDVTPVAAGGRGAGAVGGGVLAKVAGLGGAGKLAAMCLTGGLAATACVAAGIVPLPISDGNESGESRLPRIHHPKPNRVQPDQPEAAATAVPPPPTAEPAPAPKPPEPAVSDDSPVVEATQPPPVAAEVGLAPPASVAVSPSSGGGSSGSGSTGAMKTQTATQQEFGP